MLCSEFLERHCEYRDGLITSPRELRRVARHIAHCATCRRYDATIRQAVQALHASSSITPSADFRERLDARIAVERRVSRTPSPTGVSATMLVLAALTLFVFEVTHRPRIARAPLLPPAAFPNPVASASLPFVSFQDPRTSVVFPVRSLSPGTGAR
jgi:anti-sigma factor RsiW